MWKANSSSRAVKFGTDGWWHEHRRLKSLLSQGKCSLEAAALGRLDARHVALRSRRTNWPCFCLLLLSDNLTALIYFPAPAEISWRTRVMHTLCRGKRKMVWHRCVMWSLCLTDGNTGKLSNKTEMITLLVSMVATLWGPWVSVQDFTANHPMFVKILEEMFII